MPGEWVDTFSLVDYVNKALRGELQTPVCTNFGEAINLTRTWQVQPESRAESQTNVRICPYKGLEYFDCNDTDPQFFFGRDRLVSQLLDQVRTSNFMALVGASGNGKSSVLRAGLLHQIKLGRRIAGSDQWRIRITRPDRQPMQNLALAFVDDGLSDLDRAEALGRASGLLKERGEGLKRLIQASSAPRVILVIDQFEEVFTRCEDIDEREHYFACLMGTLSETDHKLCLIIAMRADFIGKCLEHKYGGLAQQVQQHMISVLPMEPNELKEAICNPAEQVGLTIEPTLVTQILNDIAGAPGSLPLLQYTLKELYQQRQGNQLVLTAYQTLGGIIGTLDKRATDLYNRFDEAQQLTVQHIFQQLTQLGEGTEDTRRRVFQSDLIAEPNHSAQQIKEVIATLSSPKNRLLVTSEVVSKSNESDRMAIVDVAHEALIRHWRLLRQWIEQNRDLLRQQRKIEASAVAWRTQNQKTGYLLQGLPLAEAKQFHKKYQSNFPLSDAAHQFIKKSIGNQHWTRIKTASWLIIPAILIGGIIEHNLREQGIRNEYDRIVEQEGTQAERKAVLDRVKGCYKKVHVHETWTWPQRYITERLYGNCRDLNRAPLAKADLSEIDFSKADFSKADLPEANLNSADLSEANLNSADLSVAYLNRAYLRDADLSSADLSSADLRDAVLSGADLSEADLRDAGLQGADLQGADLSEAKLSSVDLSVANLSSAVLRDANLNSVDLTEAILLATDLRNSQNLTPQQLSGDYPPYLCNVALPEHITDIDSNRDCEQLPQLLSDHNPNLHLRVAQLMVKMAQSKTWD